MPCKDAILENPVVGRQGQTVEDIMSMLEDKHIRSVPVVDENDKLLGIFGYDQILNQLLPVSARIEDGLQRLDFIVGAAPGVAKRLRKLYPLKVEDVLKKDCCVVYPQTPTWEAIRLLVKYGSPIPVVEEKSGIMIGIITEQSALADLKNILEEIEEDEKESASL